MPDIDAIEQMHKDFGIDDDMTVDDYMVYLKKKWEPGGEADLAQRKRIANGEGG